MPARIAFRPFSAVLAPLAAAIAFALSLPAQAALITVNQDTDSHIPGRCSLREAVQAANANQTPPGTNCVAGGLHDFIAMPFAQIVLTQGTLRVTGDQATIQGTLPGRTVITRADNASAFGIIEQDNAALTLTNLVISNGNSNSCGGGIYSISHNASNLHLENVVVSGNRTDIDGGGICVSGHQTRLTIVQSTVSGNTAAQGGGGIAAKYDIDLIDSTISGNSAARGGGMKLAGLGNGGSHLIVNSTIAGNSATGAGNDSGGGGIRLERGALTILNSTITRNTTHSDSIGGGIALVPDVSHNVALTLRSTLLSANVRGKYFQDIAANRAVTIRGSRNLVRHPQGNVTLPADTLNCTPSLGPLGDHGGPTQTIPLQPNPGANYCAIDVGIANSQTFDQRGTGFARVVGAAADIGAFEYSGESGEAPLFANGFED